MKKEKIEKVTDDKNTYENIESLRLEFLKVYNEQKTIGLIILLVFIAAMLGSLFIMTSMPNMIHYFLIAIVVIFLGTYLLTKKLKNEREKSIRSYVENYRHLINDNIYQDVELLNIEKEPFEKVAKEEIENINIFDDFETLQSNDVIKAKFKDRKFLSYSAAVYNSNNQIVFYGKVYTLDLEEEIDGELVIHLKTENGKGPAKLDKLVNVDNLLDERFACYTSLSSEAVKKLLTKKTLTSIAKFESSEIFKDITLVIKDNKIYILVSCRNDVIDVALKEKLEENLIEKQKANVDLLFEIFKGIK